MKMQFLLPAIGLVVAACGDGSDPVQPEAGHHADGTMHAADDARLSPLPEDGITPVWISGWPGFARIRRVGM